MDDGSKVQSPRELISGSNLHYFRSRLEFLELAEGVTLVHRKALSAHAPQWLVDELKLYWATHLGHHSGFTEHILLVRAQEVADRTDPFPDEQIRRRAFRAEVAFWLLKAGRLRVSGTYGPVDMPSIGNLGPLQADWDKVGSGVSNAIYSFDESEATRYREIFDLLSRYEARIGPDPAWYQISVALRAFASASESDDRSEKLLNAITAIEALVGEKHETTFRIRFRVSHLLADNDAERVEIFGAVNRYYDVRSTLVHGTEPAPGTDRKRFLERLFDSKPILEIARKLLLGFLSLIDQPCEFRSMKHLRDSIDAVLVHSEQRESLRLRMGLRRVAV